MDTTTELLGERATETVAARPAANRSTNETNPGR